MDLFKFTTSMVVLRYLVFTVFLIGNVNSFPYGVPNRPYVCQEMFPIGHGSNAQFSDPPFEINLSQNIYSEGQEEFRVTLQALHGYFIGGFFIQARRAGSCNSKEQRQPLGVFQLVPGETYLRTMSCNNRLNSSLTHRISRPLDHAVFKWFPPAKPIGHIYLVATVVKDKTTFWTTVYSEIIRDISSSAQAVRCPARMFLDPETKYTTSSTHPTTTPSHCGCATKRSYLYMVVLILSALVSYH